jgi:hypothetical protein
MFVENPVARAGISQKELIHKQAGADELMLENWKVRDGTIVFAGGGFYNLCTIREYGDFILCLEFKLTPGSKMVACNRTAISVSRDRAAILLRCYLKC